MTSLGFVAQPFAVRFGLSLVHGVGDAKEEALAAGAREARGRDGLDALGAYVTAVLGMAWNLTFIPNLLLAAALMAARASSACGI